jgi:hypothetical protein
MSTSIKERILRLKENLAAANEEVDAQKGLVETATDTTYAAVRQRDATAREGQTKEKHGTLKKNPFKRPSTIECPLQIP